MKYLDSHSFIVLDNFDDEIDSYNNYIQQRFDDENIDSQRPLLSPNDLFCSLETIKNKLPQKISGILIFMKILIIKILMSLLTILIKAN